MRVSTSQIYNSGTTGILDLQTELNKIQNQMSTGKKVVTPADDPIAAAQAVVVTQSKSVNDLYLSNLATASSTLGTLDNTLVGVYDELDSIYSSAVQAGNASYSDAQRAAIASELERHQESLLAMANMQDGTGRYIFSGTKSTTQPFTLNASANAAAEYNSSGNSYVNYNGNDGQQLLQIGASMDMAINELGSDVFVRVKDASGNSTGRSVFDSIQNLVTLLKTPGASVSNADYQQALGDIQASMDTIAVRQAAVGAKESALEGLTNSAEDKKVQYKDRLSTLQDLDYVAAQTSLTLKQTQLTAAASSFASSSKLSLFSYI